MLAVNKYTGKDYDSVLASALEDMKLNIDDVVINKEEKKAGFLKGPQVELTVVPLLEIVEFIKSYIEDLLSIMGLEVTFESKIRDRQIQIRMYSSDNTILIGKEGKTLASLQTVIRNIVKNEYGVYPYISLDVENYKDRQIMYLEKTAKRIAREVSETKIAVELDNMNSYERLIVHNAVKDFPEVYTESVGEDPNRHVIIKPKN